jgi:hypothetical protein
LFWTSSLFSRTGAPARHIDGNNQVLRAKVQAKLERGQEILSQHTAWHLKAEEKMRSKHAGAKHQRSDPRSPKNKISVRPEYLCPIHPMAGHTWSECFYNAARHKDAKKNVATTKVHKKKDEVQEANVSNIALGNDHFINDNNSFISDSELMAGVCCFEQLDTNLMDATAVDSTATGTSASKDSSQEHIGLDESITHHLHELTLDAFHHEVTTNIFSTEFIDVFTQYSDDNYSLGFSDVNDDNYSLGFSDINVNDFSKIPLKLQSTSIVVPSSRTRLMHCGKSCLTLDQTIQL